MLQRRRSASRIDLRDLNALILRDQNNDNHLVTNYFPSSSPTPMTYRDLRLTMSKTPSPNIVIVPKPNSFQMTTDTNSERHIRKKTVRSNLKSFGADVYRNLRRSDSSGNLLPKQNSEDELLLLSNFSINEQQYISSGTGFFHPQNLPNIERQRLGLRRIGSGRTQISYASSPSLHIQPVEYFQQKPRRLSQYTTTTTKSAESKQDDEQAKKLSATSPEKQTRKQLHVYVPQIYSC